MTEIIDKLYLELSLISKAKTARELALEAEIQRLRGERRTVETIKQVIECLEHVERDATMENSEFDLFFPDSTKPLLPTGEKEVTDFIRGRTSLWRETWILRPTREALKLLRQSISAGVQP